jgi:hypothetical protein
MLAEKNLLIIAAVPVAVLGVVRLAAMETTELTLENGRRLLGIEIGHWIKPPSDDV